MERSNSGAELLEKTMRLQKRRNSEEIDKLKMEGSSAKGPRTPDTWWLVGVFVAVGHIIGLYTVFCYSASWKIYLATFLTCYFTAYGITAGYHRLWSHRAYSASLPLRIVLMILGTNAFQGSIKWWTLRHRLHHRYTDTEHDPYNSMRGFYYSHMGWMFEKPYYPRIKTIDASDLNADPVVRFQHTYIVPLLLICGFGWPALCGWWLGDTVGGILWIGYVGRLYVWHATWSINSFAHWMGERLYCDNISARGNLVCAILTFGEGYHNFHHEFPRDYRNGIRWFDYDPTKWMIRLWFWLGLASKLHRANRNAILQSEVQVKENEIAKMRANLNWGPTDKELPEMTLDEFNAKVAAEKLDWMIVRSFAIDVSEFKNEHPGGAKLLALFRGKDATAAFEGGYNNHSQSARNLSVMYRVAKIKRDDAPTYETEKE